MATHGRSPPVALLSGLTADATFPPPRISYLSLVQPYFGTASWLRPFAKLVVPLQDFHHCLLHHATNRYMNMGRFQDKRRDNELFHPLTLGQAVRVLNHCTGRGSGLPERVDQVDEGAQVIRTGECWECMERGGAAGMDLIKPWQSEDHVEIKFTCMNRTQVKFHGFKGTDPGLPA